MSRRLFLLVITVLGRSSAVFGTLKSWGRDLNVDTGANWDRSRAPCAGQTAVFPADQPLAVYVRRYLVAREVVLPSNGELIFGAGASLVLTGRPDPADKRCRGADGSTVQFRRTAGDSWFSADSWHQAALPSPVPHAERVPCTGDSVVFRDNMTYRTLVAHPVTVAALTLGPHAMNTERFGAFRNSSIGRALFDVRSEFHISSQTTCTGQECVCDNYRSAALAVICGVTECREPLCSDAIKPVGHCCTMCGASVRVAGSPGLSVPALSTLVRAQLGSRDAEVRWHVGRTDRRQLQVVMVDAAEESDASKRTATALYDKLTGDPSFGITSSTLSVSGPRHSPLTWTGSSGSAAAAAVVTVLAVILLVVLLVCAVKTRRLPQPCLDTIPNIRPPSEWRFPSQVATLSRLPRDLAAAARRATSAAPFRFARFRNDDTGEVELGQRAEELEENAEESSTTSPTRGTEAAITPAAKSTPASAEGGTLGQQPSAGAGRSFDNPMFSEKQAEEDHTPVSLIAPGSAFCVTPDGKSVANPFFGVPNLTDIDFAAPAPPKPTRAPPGDEDSSTALSTVQESEEVEATNAFRGTVSGTEQQAGDAETGAKLRETAGGDWEGDATAKASGGCDTTEEPVTAQLINIADSGC